jgi:TonB family protein
MADRGSLNQLRPSLIAPQPKAVLDRDPCASGRGECVLSSLTPVTQLSRAAKPDNEKALRDANNWEVLYKLYPPRAVAAHEQGLVGFTVKIDSSGSPASCKITHSSGHPLLDLETCELIMVHATFKRAEGMSLSQQRSYEGVVNWKLPATTQSAPPAAPKRIAEATAPEEMICKRIPRTGSNAAFDRKCMRKSEWQRAADESRDVWDRLPGDGASCQGYPPRCR